jgi:DNA-binding LacI/PurR family transcriptional regulator
MSQHNSKNPSLKDIAFECDLSIAAVSMALRGHHRVSKSTIKRVKSAAKKLGYRTNPLIRSVMSLVRFSQFSKKNWITIGFIWLEETPDSILQGDYLDKLIQSLIKRANSLGLNVEQFYLNSKGMTEQRLQKILISRGISGIIFSPSKQCKSVKLSFNWSKFTTVIVGHTPWEPEFNRVGHYQYSGMRRTLQNVFKAGYKAPALIIFNNTNEQTLKNHESAFLSHYPDVKKGLKLIYYIKLENDVKSLKKWLSIRKPDSIIFPSISEKNILSECAKVLLEYPHVALDVFYGKDQAGIIQDFTTVGVNAVDLLITQLLHNDLGIPERPKVVMLAEGEWYFGKSLPKIDS